MAFNDAIVLESSAVESLNYVSNYFSTPPTDLRFLSTQFNEFHPISSLNANSKEIKFELNELCGNNFYG